MAGRLKYTRKVAVVVLVGHHLVHHVHHRRAFQEVHRQNHLATKHVAIRITQALLQKRMSQVVQVNRRRTRILNDQRLVVQVRHQLQVLAQVAVPDIRQLALLLHHNQAIQVLTVHHRIVVV